MRFDYARRSATAYHCLENNHSSRCRCFSEHNRVWSNGCGYGDTGPRCSGGILHDDWWRSEGRAGLRRGGSTEFCLAWRCGGYRDCLGSDNPRAGLRDNITDKGSNFGRQTLECARSGGRDRLLGHGDDRCSCFSYWVGASSTAARGCDLGNACHQFKAHLLRRLSAKLHRSHCGGAVGLSEGKEDMKQADSIKHTWLLLIKLL